MASDTTKRCCHAEAQPWYRERNPEATLEKARERMQECVPRFPSVNLSEWSQETSEQKRPGGGSSGRETLTMLMLSVAVAAAGSSTQFPGPEQFHIFYLYTYR
ncbi:hypothetical protein K438DRAFT_1753874 [Mycena galopus ATCC 62051]|nr:hypothetical protein K438DRAFT_1753874 [Mycena galopus ATCC 62051]